MQGLPGQCARVARAMCKGCQINVLACENKVNSFSVQLKVELGLQFREEFDKIMISSNPFLLLKHLLTVPSLFSFSTLKVHWELSRVGG